MGIAIGMSYQRLHRNEVQRFLGTGLHHNGRCHTVIEGLLPSQGTHAPLVSGLQTRKIILRPGCAEVIAARDAECKEFFGHDGAHHMTAPIVVVRAAEAIAVKSRHRVGAAGLQRLPENVGAAHGVRLGRRSYHVHAAAASWLQNLMPCYKRDRGGRRAIEPRFAGVKDFVRVK